MDRVDVATDTRWSAAAPPNIRAIPGVLDIWRAHLTTVTGGLEELLCAEERVRAARILRDRARTRWARSRGVLRAVLGSYLDADPRALRIVLSEHGKPALHGETELTSGLRFNLSHSDELLLVAVTAGREVGVDIEHARERCTMEFLREWTMREATVKCLGTGLASTPVVSADGAPAGGHADGLWTAELDVGPRAIAAVAVAGSETCKLRCWEWPG